MSTTISREMTDLTKKLPVEILEKIFQSLSLQDLSMAVLVCRRWREVGETHNTVVSHHCHSGREEPVCIVRDIEEQENGGCQ